MGKGITKTGRPSKYHDKVPEQALKLCRLGATDKELANFFGADRSEDDFLAYWLRLHREDRSGAIAAQNKKRALTRKDRSTPLGKLLNATRARMWAALKGRSDGRLFKRLGYDIDALMEHLEKSFAPGMSWENYGKWHVDHIRPCSSFNQMDEEQFLECWSLQNLQPLWASENLEKSSKYASA